jgi:N,N'-diacetyllegionaminate synthase
MKVIAESAYNHNGNFDYLIRLADAAKSSGADYFTVQLMDTEAFCTPDYSKYQLYKDTEFSPKQWTELFDYCKSISLEVIPCPLEENSFQLVYEYGFRLIKIHGTDLTNFGYLDFIQKKGDCRIILETQASTDLEVLLTVGRYRDMIDCLFHGFSNYPTEIDEHNLNALVHLKNRYGLPVGFADHSLDTQIMPCMTLSMGCKYLEKHITVKRGDRNFDYQVSLEPHEFRVMTETLGHYSQAFGYHLKYPVAAEKKFRDILFKRYTDQGEFKRSNSGLTMIDREVQSFDKSNVTGVLIARLKSERLKLKVLKPLAGSELIISLYNRIKACSRKTTQLVLATSYLPEDAQLAELFRSKNLPVHLGHPQSVLDRLLEVGFSYKSGAVFRITGDNPFTDPALMDRMIEIMLEKKVDYVRASGLPFGVSAELFSMEYLWSLYLRLDTPNETEYLTWYVYNDTDCKRALITVKSDKDYASVVNLSIDYQEDYDYALRLLNSIDVSEFEKITLADILRHITKDHIVDVEKTLKLPNGVTMKLFDYLKFLETSEYKHKETLEL